MKRSYEPELMDDFSIHDERVDLALKELRIINRFLGGITTTKSALKYFLNSDNNELSIIDIGSGSSDNLIAIKKSFPYLKIVSVDKNIRSLKSILKTSIKLNSDAFRVPVKEKSFDIVHASLFLHHFTTEEIFLLIKEFMRISKIGIVVNDLRRSFLALIGIKILTTVFSKSALVKNDAPLSVRRGFRKSELIKLLAYSNIDNYIIKRKWAFRWMLVIKK
ncbi:MAG: methyltransferase domain-containing protein [Ignavibacteriaceae bacterium]